MVKEPLSIKYSDFKVPILSLNKIPDWSMPVLRELKAKADSIWRMSDTTHYVSSISRWEGRLQIELGPKDCDDIPGSYYWYSVGYVTPQHPKKELVFEVRHDGCIEEVSCWEEIIYKLKDDLAAYNKKIIETRQKNLEQAIDSLPG